MTTLYATYCSADKRRDDELLPASARYVSARIDHTLRQGQNANARTAILSGCYGLIAPDHPIPWYDHLLQVDEVDTMVPRVSASLGVWEIVRVKWFSVDSARDPNVAVYRQVMERACASLGIPMHTVIVQTA